jgi:hypothetical protein
VPALLAAQVAALRGVLPQAEPLPLPKAVAAILG